MKKLLSVLIMLMLALGSVTPAFAYVDINQPTAVRQAITSVSISPSSLTLTVGQTKSLQVSYSYSGKPETTTPTWTTSNKKVATVKNGVVTAVGKGTCTITAKMGSKSKSIKVTVNKAANKFVDVSSMYKSINSYRKSAKVGNVKRDANLEKIAKERAKQITGLFDHAVPKGTKTSKVTYKKKTSSLTYIKQRMKELKMGTNVYLGENIAYGQTSVTEVMKTWYKSKGHRQNMLKKQYKKVGFAGYKYNNRIYWVQIFTS